jgi:mono/diheme cytochrome c family protein
LISHRSSFSTVIVSACCALGLVAAGCGSSKSSKTTPAPVASTLTASFTGTCAASCHGADGASTPPGARTGHGLLKGTALTEAAFLSAVRNGSGTGMSKYDASIMSDADVQTNFTALTAK